MDTDKHYVGTSVTKQSLQQHIMPESRDSSTGSGGNLFGLCAPNGKKQKLIGNVTLNYDMINTNGWIEATNRTQAPSKEGKDRKVSNVMEQFYDK